MSIARPRPTVTSKVVRARAVVRTWSARRWQRRQPSMVDSLTFATWPNTKEPSMKAFTQHTGLVAPLDRANVDTDQIIPKQFLKSIKRTGFGPNLFDEWRYLDVGYAYQDNSKRRQPAAGGGQRALRRRLRRGA